MTTHGTVWRVDTFARFRPARPGQACVTQATLRVKPKSGKASRNHHDALELSLGDEASIDLQPRRGSVGQRLRFGFRRVIDVDAGQEAVFKLTAADMVAAARRRRRGGTGRRLKPRQGEQLDFGPAQSDDINQHGIGI